jgi:hypothetical protein
MPRPAPLLVVLILTACGSVTPPGAVPTVVPTATGATRARTATGLSGSATATGATATRAGQLSGYRWSFEAGHTTIADGFPNARALEPLAAPPGAVLILTVGGATPPVRVDVQPYPLEEQPPRVGAPYLPALPVSLAGQQAVVTATLAPGGYLLLVIVRWGGSQAGYGFRVALGP